ncbi:MAG TPA: hypothetical protein PKD85_08200 [Saprospiraceae bacterium]|nr:hypothetical protein [Saprospiraceae bacterium]
MHYLILGISLYIFLLSFEEKKFINVGDLSLTEDQRTKLFKAVKPFLQILSLSLATIGLAVNYYFGKDAGGLFLWIYTLFYLFVGILLAPKYVGAAYTKFHIIILVLFFAMFSYFLSTLFN